jgi:hypothetical protein
MAMVGKLAGGLSVRVFMEMVWAFLIVADGHF